MLVTIDTQSGEIASVCLFLIGMYNLLLPIWRKYRYLEVDATLNGILPYSKMPILEYDYNGFTFQHYFEPEEKELQGDLLTVFINPRFQEYISPI